MVDRRPEVGHRRVQDRPAHDPGQLRLVEEIEHRPAAHAVAHQHHIVRAVRQRISHRPLEVAPLSQPILILTGRVGRRALVVAVVDQQARHAKVGGGLQDAHTFGTLPALTVDVDHPGGVVAGSGPGRQRTQFARICDLRETDSQRPRRVHREGVHQPGPHSRRRRAVGAAVLAHDFAASLVQRLDGADLPESTVPAYSPDSIAKPVVADLAAFVGQAGRAQRDRAIRHRHHLHTGDSRHRLKPPTAQYPGQVPAGGQQQYHHCPNPRQRPDQDPPSAPSAHRALPTPIAKVGYPSGSRPILGAA